MFSPYVSYFGDLVTVTAITLKRVTNEVVAQSARRSRFVALGPKSIDYILHSFVGCGLTTKTDMHAITAQLLTLRVMWSLLA